MQILFLAPQPFYQNRGTPIAIDKMLQILSERGEHVDVLTYHEGEDVRHPNVAIYRTPKLPFVHDIRPGFSWKKIVCDFFLLIKAISLASRKHYHIIHAVEEAAFIALVLRVLFKTPYVYDMDSSLKQQLIETCPILARLSVLLSYLEGIAINYSIVVVPVCDALAVSARQYSPNQIVILPDVSLLEETAANVPNLRTQLGVRGVMLMYVGNLEVYQGIDLLLESFALVRTQTDAALVIIGGTDTHIQQYQAKADRLGLADKIHFLGPKPILHLAKYLAQADILVSPRIRGTNTPMKIYSYLDSGKAVLATNLPTHTHVLDEHVAVLVDPVPQQFADGMLRLIENSSLRQKLGQMGQSLVREEFSWKVFYDRVNSLYDWITVKTLNRVHATLLMFLHVAYGHILYDVALYV